MSSTRYRGVASQLRPFRTEESTAPLSAPNQPCTTHAPTALHNTARSHGSAGCVCHTDQVTGSQEIRLRDQTNPRGSQTCVCEWPIKLRILGVVITANGSAKAWIREIKQQAHQVLHLIRRISSKAGGARTKIARLLVRAVLQPRLIYSAQFQHLTVRDWARLECINREAVRVVTGLPRCTPIPILQEEAQLNTIDELIYQRRRARELKPSFLPPAANLAAYMGNPVSASPPSIVSLPPWDHRQLTDNKPIGRLRNPVPRPTTTFRRHIEEADAALPTAVSCHVL
ncbi:hypothetical protein HPB52_001094 [Rhipicephalus sanguineus]|uniref:Tick transposon n=1 Tax=Rhipicephalus sanguineus TaxID=34632 RepID=A0A9D4T6F1_RHISA|nr:hypothetical protein HPB52_001094 [Rhipicephalus sanguineus]